MSNNLEPVTFLERKGFYNDSMYSFISHWHGSGNFLYGITVNLQHFEGDLNIFFDKFSEVSGINMIYVYKNESYCHCLIFSFNIISLDFDAQKMLTENEAIEFYKNMAKEFNELQEPGLSLKNYYLLIKFPIKNEYIGDVLDSFEFLFFAYDLKDDKILNLNCK